MSCMKTKINHLGYQAFTDLGPLPLLLPLSVLLASLGAGSRTVCFICYENTLSGLDIFDTASYRSAKIHSTRTKSETEHFPLRRKAPRLPSKSTAHEHNIYTTPTSSPSLSHPRTNLHPTLTPSSDLAPSSPTHASPILDNPDSHMPQVPLAITLVSEHDISAAAPEVGADGGEGHGWGDELSHTLVKRW